MTVDDVAQLLRDCGFEPRVAVGSWQKAYVVPRGDRMLQNSRDGGYRFLSPRYWPWLPETGKTVFSNDLIYGLFESYAQGAVQAGGSPSDVLAALDMYQVQRELLSRQGRSSENGLYTFEDCLRFAAAHNDMLTMAQLMVLQVPRDVMLQVASGEQSASVMVELYRPTFPGKHGFKFNEDNLIG